MGWSWTAHGLGPAGRRGPRHGPAGAAPAGTPFAHRGWGPPAPPSQKTPGPSVDRPATIGCSGGHKALAGAPPPGRPGPHRFPELAWGPREQETPRSYAPRPERVAAVPRAQGTSRLGWWPVGGSVCRGPTRSTLDRAAGSGKAGDEVDSRSRPGRALRPCASGWRNLDTALRRLRS